MLSMLANTIRCRPEILNSMPSTTTYCLNICCTACCVAFSAEVESTCCGGWHTVQNFRPVSYCVCQQAELHDEWHMSWVACWAVCCVGRHNGQRFGNMTYLAAWWVTWCVRQHIKQHALQHISRSWGSMHTVQSFGPVAYCVWQHAQNHNEYILFFSKTQWVKQLHPTGVLKQP